MHDVVVALVPWADNWKFFDMKTYIISSTNKTEIIVHQRAYSKL